MEGLVGEEEDFVGYAGLDRQPVEVEEGVRTVHNEVSLLKLFIIPFTKTDLKEGRIVPGHMLKEINKSFFSLKY